MWELVANWVCVGTGGELGMCGNWWRTGCVGTGGELGVWELVANWVCVCVWEMVANWVLFFNHPSRSDRQMIVHLGYTGTCLLRGGGWKKKAD